jgi:hypothetical protein
MYRGKKWCALAGAKLCENSLRKNAERIAWEISKFLRLEFHQDGFKGASRWKQPFTGQALSEGILPFRRIPFPPRPPCRKSNLFCLNSGSNWFRFPAKFPAQT